MPMLYTVEMPSLSQGFHDYEVHLVTLVTYYTGGRTGYLD